MKKLLFGIVAGSFFMVSCSKDDDPVTPAVDKFINTTNGSTWNYKTTNNSNGAITNYTQTSSDRDTASGGRSYHVYENSNGTNEYLTNSGSDYYRLQVFALGTVDTTLVNLYLKDNAGIGTNWNQAYSLDLGIGIPVDVTVTNTVIEKGISKTVNSILYSNVIHVETTISIPALATIPGSTFTTDIDYYYAPKFGLIQNNAKIDLEVPAIATQHTDTKTELQSAILL